MKFLCVETSNTQGFIALFSNEKKEKELIWDQGKHSEKLAQNIQPFLNKDHTLDVDFIAVNYGPGRFTGIRAGVNFSKTLSYALSLPVYLCCSLRIMAQPYLEKQNKPVLCLMTAFGGQFYTAVYQKTGSAVQTLLQPSAFSKEQIDPYVQQDILCIGDVCENNQNLFSQKFQAKIQPYSMITSSVFSKMVLSEWKKEDLEKWEKVEPLYLRVPGVLKEKKNKSMD